MLKESCDDIITLVQVFILKTEVANAKRPDRLETDRHFVTLLHLGTHCTLFGSEIPYRTLSVSDTQIPGQRAGSGCRVK